MTGPRRPQNRKEPERVEVIYFPKRKVPARRLTHELPAVEGNATKTVEFRPNFMGDDDRTESAADAPARGRDARRSSTPRRLNTPTEELPAYRDEEPASRPATKAPGRADKPSRKSAAGTERKKKGARGPRRVSVEIDTNPALRYHAKKLEELMQASSPSEPLRSMSRRELAEMSLFGHQLFELGRYDEARVVFEGLVALDVDDAFPHTMLGTVYLAMGKADRAMALFEAALSIDPDDLAARVYRAEIRINRGQLKSATAELETVIADHPEEDPFVQRAVRLREIVNGKGRRRR